MKTTHIILGVAKLICSGGSPPCVAAGTRGNYPRVLPAQVFFGLLALALAAISALQAAPPSWSFQPRKVGQ
ncbi:MAG: hypothetical protein WCI20_10060, partial [bacterium]